MPCAGLFRSGRGLRRWLGHAALALSLALPGMALAQDDPAPLENPVLLERAGEAAQALRAVHKQYQTLLTTMREQGARVEELTLTVDTLAVPEAPAQARPESVDAAQALVDQWTARRKAQTAIQDALTERQDLLAQQQTTLLNLNREEDMLRRALTLFAPLASTLDARLAEGGLTEEGVTEAVGSLPEITANSLNDTPVWQAEAARLKLLREAGQEHLTAVTQALTEEAPALAQAQRWLQAASARRDMLAQLSAHPLGEIIADFRTRVTDHQEQLASLKKALTAYTADQATVTRLQERLDALTPPPLEETTTTDGTRQAEAALALAQSVVAYREQQQVLLSEQSEALTRLVEAQHPLLDRLAPAIESTLELQVMASLIADRQDDSLATRMAERLATDLETLRGARQNLADRGTQDTTALEQRRQALAELQKAVAPLGLLDREARAYSDHEAALGARQQDVQRAIHELEGYETEALEDLIAHNPDLAAERERLAVGELGLLDREHERQLYRRLAIAVGSLVAIPLGGLLVILIFRFMGQRFIRRLKRDQVNGQDRAQRAEVIFSSLNSVVTLLVIALSVIYMLKMVNVDVTPLIASLGIFGLAVAFGAQPLMRDLIAGFFLLMENQLNRGDIVTINGITGVVEEVKLRTVRLRDTADGRLHYIANGDVTAVGNYNRLWMRLRITIHTALTEDPARVEALLSRVGEEMAQDPDYRTEIRSVTMLGGINDISVETGSLSFVILLDVYNMGWGVGREYRRRVKAAFEQAGIAFAQRTNRIQIDRYQAPDPTATPETEEPPQTPQPAVRLRTTVHVKGVATATDVETVLMRMGHGLMDDPTLGSAIHTVTMVGPVAEEDENAKTMAFVMLVDVYHDADAVEAACHDRTLEALTEAHLLADDVETPVTIERRDPAEEEEHAEAKLN